MLPEPAQAEAENGDKSGTAEAPRRSEFLCLLANIAKVSPFVRGMRARAKNLAPEGSQGTGAPPLPPRAARGVTARNVPQQISNEGTSL